MNRFFKVSTTTLLAIGVGTMAATPSHAASLSFSLNPFTGDSAKVDITLTENNGEIEVFAEVDTDTAIADLRGIFFDYTDGREDTILPKLEISNFSAWGLDARSNTTSMSDVQIGKNAVSGGIGSANFQGGGAGNICANGCDGGIEIGQNGLKGGKDDYQYTRWNFTHSDGQALTLTDLENMNWGARVMSVGENREGSSKLSGLSSLLVTKEPTESEKVPEPSILLSFVVLAGGTTLVKKHKSSPITQA